MRDLKFSVSKQILECLDNDKLEQIVPGSENILRAVFSFTKDWDETVRVVEFRSKLGKEYTPQVLSDNLSCMIPSKALIRRTFYMRVLGKKKDGSKICTNFIAVTQNGGR